MKIVLQRLDPRWTGAASSELCINLSKLIEGKVSGGVRHILAWVSFFPGEANLSKFIADHIESHRVYLPRIQADGGMSFYSIGLDWQLNLDKGPYGIPEPKLNSGEMFNPDDSDEAVVIVPGLVFDNDGNRLGRGKGFYDRFLSQNKIRSATKIGVCWTLQLVDELDTESHDIMMDWVCHERGFIHTGAQFDDEIDEI